MLSIPLFYLLFCLILLSWHSCTKTCCDAIALPSSAALRTSNFLRPIRFTQQTSINAAKSKKSVRVVTEEEMEEEVKIIGAMIPGDPVVTATVAQGIASLFSFYNTILLVRIGLSWFPQLYSQFPILRTLQVVTDPYLGVFRSVIPSVGGFDISPIPAFFFLDVMSQTAVAVAADVSTVEKMIEKNKKRFQETFQFKI